MDFKLRNFNLPVNIFYFFNLSLDPLSFVLDWDTSDKFYCNLLNRYFANVLDQPNEHSMVLTKPNNSTYFHNIIPAFDIQYIEQCFNLKDFPDPTFYLIKKSCPITYSKQDIVDCWIHQTKSWTDLIPVQNDDDDDDDDDDSDNKLGRKKSFTNSNEKNHYVLDSNDDDHTYSNRQLHCKASSSTLSKKKSRLPYTQKEDAEIVKYIIDNGFAFNVAGTKIWKNMERTNICKIRSWQSMKERYIKHIKFDLSTENYKFPFLSKCELELLRLGLNIDVIK